MTTKNEPQCGFCGGTEFNFIEGIGEWMLVCCGTCDLWLPVRKAKPSAAAHEEPNRSTSIDRYVEHTERIAMQMLKNDAVIELKLDARDEPSDLKPCPFCGNAGRYKYLKQKGRDTWGVRCPRSGCMGGAGPFTGYQWTKEEARDIWNSRYIDAAKEVNNDN